MLKKLVLPLVKQYTAYQNFSKSNRTAIRNKLKLLNFIGLSILKRGDTIVFKIKGFNLKILNLLYINGINIQGSLKKKSICHWVATLETLLLLPLLMYNENVKDYHFINCVIYNIE